jgi:hypothetical protein
LIGLKITHDEALEYLEGIDNSAFQKALPQNWHADVNGYVRAQSVLWLFCWAKTGMGKQEMAEEAQAVFDVIFPFSYNYCEARVDHEWAREKRYANGDMEEELSLKLEM